MAGTDIETHRELVSGIYFGPRGSGGSKERGDRWGSNTMHYTEGDVRAIMIPALQAAAERRGILHVVDKNNVLQEVGKIWRDVAKEEAEKFPGVELKHMYVDNAAQKLVDDPRQFDVIATSNIFGDILSDLISKLPGSMGMAPSASIGKGPKKLFEPVHGSAPDIAGQGKVNPIAMILSAGLMFKYAFGREREAAAVKRAVNRVLLEGFRTGDLVRPNDGTPKEMILGTDKMGEEIVKAID